MEAALEVLPEYVIFGIAVAIHPRCAEATDQADNPDGGLQRLVSMAFQLERGFDKVAPRMRPAYLGDALQWNRVGNDEPGDQPDMFARGDALEVFVPAVTLQNPPRTLAEAILSFPSVMAEYVN